MRITKLFWNLELFFLFTKLTAKLVELSNNPVGLLYKLFNFDRISASLRSKAEMEGEKSSSPLL